MSNRQKFAGVNLAVDPCGIVYEEAFRPAPAEFNLPIQLKTRFVIASINRSMSRAFAIRLLQE
ncbi:MAG: hypothetical protein ABIZ95_13880 [Pyrinomonadaceae bacterium]